MMGRELSFCLVLVGLGVCVGCSSSKDAPAAGAGGAAGSSGAAGAAGSSGAGGAAGSSGAGGAGGAAGQDAGGVCTAKPPADPAPDLTGLWAWKTVGSRLMPKTALTPAFRTRTISILLAQQTQTGTVVEVKAQYCDQYAEEDTGAVTHVTIPDAYKKTLAQFTRTGTYGVQGDGGTASLVMPQFAEVEGAHVADPANGVLPTVATDPQVFDQDADGNPGVTIKISGLVSGDLYVVQRQKSDLLGVATGADRVEGHYGFTSEQVILGSTSALLQSAASSQQAITDPNACASTFTMVRLPGSPDASLAATTCADVLANVATLFP
jgi:hypothetical protein